MGAADLPNPDEKTVNAGKLTNFLYCHVLIRYEDPAVRRRRIVYLLHTQLN